MGLREKTVITTMLALPLAHVRTTVYLRAVVCIMRNRRQRRTEKSRNMASSLDARIEITSHTIADFAHLLRVQQRMYQATGVAALHNKHVIIHRKASVSSVLLFKLPASSTWIDYIIATR